MPLEIQSHKQNILTPPTAQRPIDMSRVQNTINSFLPISSEYVDHQGNRVRLWEGKNTLFYGTVLDTQGKVKIIPSHKIINPLCKGSSDQALQKIKQLKNTRWDLAYLKPTGQIIVWPHLIASAKDQIAGSVSPPTETKETAEWQQPRFPEGKGVLGHIFKKTKGHFERDTPENRAYILEAVSSPKNKVGVDAFGKELYFKIMPDGTQAWAYVQNGVIKSGGCNRIPMQWIVDPKLDQGGKLVPLKSHAHPPDVTDFVERIQSNQLSTFYNSFHPKKAIALHPAEMREIKEEVKGVSHTVGTILNLLEELQTSEISEHFFFIPDVENNFSLSENEVKQVLLELARGIYIYDTIPFFSLHFNSQMQLYPVIHPVYKNTFIGHTISTLDYYMKGFCNGSFFEETFIQEWNKNPTTDKKLLKEKSIDFREYCKKHLGEASLTFHEFFLEVEKQSGKCSQGLIFTKKLDISYRIVGKQNSIKKAENLFTLDGDFDVFYTIGNQPSSKDQEPHFQNLEKTCQLMCEQIKEKLPRLPGMKKLFDAMNLMNFYVYYFNTLKTAEKIPTLNGFLPTELKVCPSLFPPLPESEAAKMSFKPASLFKHLPKEQIAIFISYLKQPNSKDLEEAALNILTAAIEKTILRKTSNKDLTFDEYKELALALLPACKGRYQATHRSAEATLINMQIKTNPNENLTGKEISSRMNELLQGIQRDIEGVEKIIRDKKNKRLPHTKESQWLLDLQHNKEQVLKYKPILEQWFQDPLATIFAEAVISLNLVTKDLTVEREKSSGKIHVAGGCVICIKDMISQEDFNSSFLLKKYGPTLSSMPSDKMIKVETDKPGVLFKLSFESFHVIEEDKAQSAIGYLYPSSLKYPMNDAIARVFHAINTQNEKIFVEVADQIKEWNFQDALGVSFIHYAASTPNPFFLQELIHRKVDLKVRDSQGLTALHYAAKKGNLACLKMLIDAAPTIIDAQTDDGETPLYIAAQNNQLIIVQTLIKEKINLNLTTKHGMNSLICALHHGYEQIALELLHTQSTDVEYCLLNGKTALHFAIETKMENALKELIKQGANVNRTLRNGYRPIHLAVIYDWLNGIKILSTSENIKLEAPLTSGKTARDLAVENNRREIVEFFDLSRSRAISWWTPWKLFYAKL